MSHLPNIPSIPTWSSLGSYSEVAGSAFKPFAKKREMAGLNQLQQGVEATPAGRTLSIGFSSRIMQEAPQNCQSQPRNQQQLSRQQ